MDSRDAKGHLLQDPFANDLQMPFADFLYFMRNSSFIDACLVQSIT